MFNGGTIVVHDSETTSGSRYPGYANLTFQPPSQVAQAMTDHSPPLQRWENSTRLLHPSSGSDDGKRLPALRKFQANTPATLLLRYLWRIQRLGHDCLMPLSIVPFLKWCAFQFFFLDLHQSKSNAVSVIVAVPAALIDRLLFVGQS